MEFWSFCGFHAVELGQVTNHFLNDPVLTDADKVLVDQAIGSI